MHNVPRSQAVLGKRPGAHCSRMRIKFRKISDRFVKVNGRGLSPVLQCLFSDAGDVLSLLSSVVYHFSLVPQCHCVCVCVVEL